jgi:t-SNARE complex subunit (syntaxin)
MTPEPDDANQSADLDPAEKKMQSTTGKEWTLVYVFIVVVIVIVALTAYHLTHG